MEMTKKCRLTCYYDILNISEKFVVTDLCQHIAEFHVSSSQPIGILEEIPTSPFFHWHIFMSVGLNFFFCSDSIKIYPYLLFSYDQVYRASSIPLTNR